MIELIDDLEDRLLALLRWCMRLEQAPDAQVFAGPLAFWNQSIGGLLHPVVKEPIRAPASSTSSRRTASHRSAWTCSADVPSTSARVVTSALLTEARERLQGLLGCRRQAGQLAEHQVGHVVGVTLGPDAIEIPGPARVRMIEA